MTTHDDQTDQSDQISPSYELEPTAPVPSLPGSVRVGEDIEETLDMLAADLYLQSSSCVGEFGDFHLVLSHGSIQESLIIKMMIDPKYRSMPWSRTHVWSIGEQRVEPGNKLHSMTHWHEILADAGSMPPEQFHHLPGHLPDADALYAKELTEHLEWREKGHDRIDFVLLDHQSLYKGISNACSDKLFEACAESGGIWMHQRCLDAARFISVLGIGPAGRALLKEIEHDHTKIPLTPIGGHLRWYLDGYACQHTQDQYTNEERPENTQ